MNLFEASESEKQTRKRRIDPKLNACGWDIVPFDASTPLSHYKNAAIEEYPTDAGPADYALCVDGQLLGIVEAKKVTLGPQNVLTQAARYSRGVAASSMNFDGHRIPFLYSTNGEVIWHHDVRHPFNLSRQIAGFHTPNALREMLKRDIDDCSQHLLNLPNDHQFLRDYQREASGEIEKAISERKRKMLVAMATGTGKTFTMVNQVYRLMKSGAARRILFLVDRRALAAQAVRSFASFEPEPGQKFNQLYQVYSQRFFADDLEDGGKFDPNVLPSSYLTDPSGKEAFVYVCTIQRMMINLFGSNAVVNGRDEEADDDAEQLNIPIHAFDVIIADECHRGYRPEEISTWRNTLEHFDAVKIGLTATPAAHTKVFFENVVFRYEYERAVREGHLVDYDAVKIRSDVRMNGVFIQEGEQVGVVDTTSGIEQLDLLEDERQYTSTEVEEKVTSPDSNRKVLQEIRKYAIEHEQEYGRFPKILIFADNDVPHISHADQLVRIAREVFGQGESFVQKITGRVDRPLQRIREFRNRMYPQVVVTVDMLSTGVDIPDLEYIVFLRQVKSRILFEQMLGRGTRKGDKYPDKSHFTVFDCFDGTLLEYFKKATTMTVESCISSTDTIVEIIEYIWDNNDRKYNIKRLVKRLQRIDKQMSGAARDVFSSYIPDGDMAKFAAGLPEMLASDFSSVMSLLRNPDFQNLLMNYPRAIQPFLVALENEDTVESEWLVRGADGKEYKPDDYLQAFAAFVKDNADEIDAITILMNRPKDWGTQPLCELQTKLKSAPQHFTVENLQKVHNIHYRKSLVDIISMVKHAIAEGEPLLTAEERVNQAMNQLLAGKQFTPEQQQWLDRIRGVLIHNLSIEQNDFDLQPALEHYGGWRKAAKVFDGQLESLISQINEAIAR